MWVNRFVIKRKKHNVEGTNTFMFILLVKGYYKHKLKDNEIVQNERQTNMLANTRLNKCKSE